MTKNIFTMRSENMSDTQMREVNRLASLGFEQSEGGMYEDTGLIFWTLTARN